MTTTDPTDSPLDPEEISDHAWKEFSAHSNVVGVGYGHKKRNGEYLSERAVIVFVESKLPEDHLSQEDIIPDEVTVDTVAYETDVQQSGQIVFLNGGGSERSSRDTVVAEPPQGIRRTERHRPAYPGVSCGHPLVTGGTLGTPPLRTVDDEIIFMTSASAGAAFGQAHVGDYVLQPSRMDEGISPDDGIGTLIEFSTLSFDEENSTHTALVKIRPEAVENYVIGISPLHGWRQAELGTTHLKSGRTTGVTPGRCIARGATFEIQGHQGSANFRSVDVFEGMALGGDSGGLIGIEIEDRFYGTSILFAGSNAISLGISMEAVQDFHGQLDILDQGESEDQRNSTLGELMSDVRSTFRSVLSRTSYIHGR